MNKFMFGLSGSGNRGTFTLDLLIDVAKSVVVEDDHTTQQSTEDQNHERDYE